MAWRIFGGATKRDGYMNYMANGLKSAALFEEQSQQASDDLLTDVSNPFFLREGRGHSKLSGHSVPKKLEDFYGKNDTGTDTSWIPRVLKRLQETWSLSHHEPVPVDLTRPEHAGEIDELTQALGSLERTNYRRSHERSRHSRGESKE